MVSVSSPMGVATHEDHVLAASAALTRRTGRIGTPIVLIGALLASCAGYQPAPLPQGTALSPVAPASMAPGRPLSVSDLVAIALTDNLDLRALRLQHAVAQGQRQRDSAAPNPTLSGALLPLLSGAGTVTAWNAALSVDIKALITLSARRDAATHAAEQVDAQILWQEWQTVGQVRLVAVDLIEGARLRALLLQTRTLLADRVQRDQAALARGDATLTMIAPGLGALQSVQTRLDDLDALQLSRRHQLNALLGLAPDVMLTLADTADLPVIDPEALSDPDAMAMRRPDLVALRLGYAAEDARVRAAILGQFPALTLGGTIGSDNAKVINGGPQASIGLPIFDRNQGGVSVEQATREQLRAEYVARLASAVGQLAALRRETATQTERLARLHAEMSAADALAARADAAFQSRDLDARTHADLASLRLARAEEIQTLQQSLLEQRVAIATLTGAGLPPVENLPKDSPK